MRLRNQKLLIFFALLALCCLPDFSFSRQSSKVSLVRDAEDGYKKALQSYLNKDYYSARRQFEVLASSPLIHQRKTVALLMAGKSLYKLHNYSKSIPYFDRLVTSFPQSKYVDDAYYARATAKYRLSEHLEAVKDLLWVTSNSNEKNLLLKNNRLLKHLMFTRLSDKEVEKLLHYANGEDASALVTLALAAHKLHIGEDKYAQQLLDNHTRRYGHGKYARQIDQLSREIKNGRSRATRIGIVLPLSGYFSEEGRGVLRGIRFAHSQKKGNSSRLLDIVVRDSESRMIKAIKNTKDLIIRERVQAIIGDLESQITAGIGALAAERQITVIGPTATENGVASVGATVFQLNSDLERKGRALAEYAWDSLGMRTFATLAPADEYGQQMVASFSSLIDELGGRIIAQSWYYAGSKDFGRQFKNIREAAFHFDSTDVELLIQEAEEEGKTLNERDIPVMSIDGFFIPIYSEDIQYVAPQFARSNIRSQILGGEYLDDLEVLKGKQIKQYINGAIFVSDYFPDETNRDFRTFRSDFRLKMKKTPERWDVFGYDAYQIVANAIKNGAKTGLEISREIEQLSDFKGQKGSITFRGHNRVNSDVNILQFINNRIVKQQN